MLPYSDTRSSRLLTLADERRRPADRRWLPWLLALTGARVGELAQLWGNRITEVDGIPVMKISPAEDGGSLKNAMSERSVPIHPALIDRGFLVFVRAKAMALCSTGVLARVGRNPPAGGTPPKVSRTTWRLGSERTGFADPAKAPNHAFRHWFKTACQKAGVLDSVADALQGQSGGRGEADRYRHFDAPTLYKAIKRVRVPGTATAGRATNSAGRSRGHEQQG